MVKFIRDWFSEEHAARLGGGAWVIPLIPAVIAVAIPLLALNAYFVFFTVPVC